jgi:hypothetical protein
MMNYLPNRKNAVVKKTKITEYLLSLDHPLGRTKASFFYRFGFNAGNWELLRDAFIEDTENNEVYETHENNYGIKYNIRGPIHTPDDRNPIIESVWIIKSQSETPYLITAFPA